MTDKQLKNKAIDIKGKQYVLVSDRILFFNETYPNWCIQTTLITQPTDDVVMIRAIVIPDVTEEKRVFTGYAQEKWGEWFINKTSALENAETSAVGRALAMMWIGVIDSIASVDEINKATNRAKQDTTPVETYVTRLKKLVLSKIPQWLDSEQALEEANNFVKTALDMDVFDFSNAIDEQQAKDLYTKILQAWAKN